MKFLKNMLCGAIIGLANVIPGVSGGTMMVILNIYDDLVGAISNLKKRWKESLYFLAAVGIGGLLAIVLFSKGINYLLEHQYMIINFFFIGVIVGSFPMIYKRATAEKLKPVHVIPFLITLAIMILTIVITPDETAQKVVRTLSPGLTVQLVLCSAVAAICMIIPGISGSFMMLLFGTYQTVITAIDEFNILVLIPIGIGVLLGILLGAKLIEWLLKRFPQETYLAILGFVVGSVPVLVDKIITTNSFQGGITLVGAVMALLFGVALTLLFESKKFKERFVKKDLKTE